MIIFQRNIARRPPISPRLSLLLCLAVLILGWSRSLATPVAGFQAFYRPVHGGVAISVQAILGADSDTALVPIFVGSFDPISAQGAVISRTNDWLYYQPATNAPIIDSFRYVLTNLLQQSTTGTIEVIGAANLPSTNNLTITNLGSVGKLIAFSGAVGSYNLLSSSNLQSWQNLAARLAWPTGSFNFLDAGANSQTSPRFYRAATGALAPAITNFQAQGTANVQVDFELGVEGGALTPYPATIESLPALGYLFQDDGSVLSNTPATITGANGSLHYFGPPNGSGSNYASFNYKITRPADGLDSLPANFQISLGDDTPIITYGTNRNFPEDIGGFLQLTASDPDLRYSSNRLFFQVIFSPVIGKLYQVNADGTANTNQPINDFTPVSDTNGWVYYQPPPLRYGAPFDSITVQAANSFGDTSEAIELPFDVYFVNHPPVAYPLVVDGTVDNEPLNAILPADDVDGNLTNLCFPVLPARGQIYVSFRGPFPDFPVTATNNCVQVGNNPIYIVFYSDSATNGIPCYPDNSDVGSPYAEATYVITDAGDSSSTNVIVFNVGPSSVPFSIPAGPFAYTNLINTSIPISFAMTNPAGAVTTSQVDVTLESLPQHGSLYLGSHPITLTPTILPQDPSILYVPNPGYYSSRDGLDSFTYQSDVSPYFSFCNVGASLDVLAPPIVVATTSSLPFLNLDANGDVVTPAFVNWVAVTPRDAPASALLQVTVAGTTPGSPPYGYFTFNSTNGLGSFQTNGPVSVQFQGTAAAINTALAAGFKYYSTTSSEASHINVTLSDLGAVGIGTNTSSVSLPVSYSSPLGSQ